MQFALTHCGSWQLLDVKQLQLRQWRARRAQAEVCFMDRRRARWTSFVQRRRIAHGILHKVAVLGQISGSHSINIQQWYMIAPLMQCDIVTAACAAHTHAQGICGWDSWSCRQATGAGRTAHLDGLPMHYSSKATFAIARHAWLRRIAALSCAPLTDLECCDQPAVLAPLFLFRWASRPRGAKSRRFRPMP